MNDARAFWVTAPGRGEIRAEHLPAAGEGDAVVRALYSGISRGTESLVFRGQVPASEYQRMRAPFQGGEFPAPVKFGYSSVGVVEAGPAGLAGQSVFCLYPHQTRYVVPAEALQLLPPGVPPARAVLAANLETALNGLWDAGLAAGRPPGAWSAAAPSAASSPGWPGGSRAAASQLVDVAPARAATAAALGVGVRDAGRGRAGGRPA